MIWRESFQSELNDSLKQSLRQAALGSVKSCLEEALRQELSEHLGFGRYERQPGGAKGSRSGYFKRRVTTDHGEIPDLQVPKLRSGNKEREWKILTRYQRCLGYLLDTVLYLYVLGLSLRDLQEALTILLGPVLSVNAINQVTLQVQSKMNCWQQQPLSQTPPIILVDGVWVKILYSTPTTWVDRAGHTRQERRVQERVILAALAVWPDGHSQLLHYEVAQAEDEASWQTFWQHLLERGLQAKAVKLVVRDGTKGLLAAMKQSVPQAKLQRCTVHKVRGFERYLTYSTLPEVDPATGQPLAEAQAKRLRQTQITMEAHDIFKAPTLAEAQQRLHKFNEKWQALEPKAVKNFNHGLKRCFEFYHFDPALHLLIHSTNLLERFFREFRAKSDEIGSFPNEDSCLTIFYLVMVRDHAKHQRLTFAKT